MCRITLFGMEDLRIELSSGSRDGVRILKLIGPFTLKDVFEFQTAVRLDAAPLTVIDLSQVPYMDSAALGSVAGASSRLQTMFKVAGVDGLLASCASVLEATA